MSPRFLLQASRTEVQLPELGAVEAGRCGGRGHRGFSKGHVECGMTGRQPEVPARISMRQLDTNTVTGETDKNRGRPSHLRDSESTCRGLWLCPRVPWEPEPVGKSTWHACLPLSLPTARNALGDTHTGSRVLRGRHANNFHQATGSMHGSLPTVFRL